MHGRATIVYCCILLDQVKIVTKVNLITTVALHNIFLINLDDPPDKNNNKTTNNYNLHGCGLKTTFNVTFYQILMFWGSLFSQLLLH